MNPSIVHEPFRVKLIQAVTNLAFAAVSGFAASAALICVGLLLHGWEGGGDERYPFTNGLLELVSVPSILAAVLLLLPLGRVTALVYPASVVSFSVPYFVALEYELNLPGGHHNLYPFEILYVLACSFLLHIPSFLLRIYLVWRGVWPTGRRSVGKVEQ